MTARFGDDRLPERFWAKVVEKESGCWEWTGCGNRGGYGAIKVTGRMVMAHRMAFEALQAHIPEGLVIDHLCRNRGCCNPAHLEPVTFKENVLRGESFTAVHARKTGCGKPNHGAFDARRPEGARECSTCRTSTIRRRTERNRVARALAR